MKKKIAVIVVAVVLCIAAAVFAVPKISFYACEPTVYFDSPSCGFSENASIRIGCNTYMPACDGDETVKHGFMYFSLSKSENNELRKIMKKYGADTRKAI